MRGVGLTKSNQPAKAPKLVDGLCMIGDVAGRCRVCELREVRCTSYLLESLRITELLCDVDYVMRDALLAQLEDCFPDALVGVRVEVIWDKVRDRLDVVGTLGPPKARADDRGLRVEALRRDATSSVGLS